MSPEFIALLFSVYFEMETTRSMDAFVLRLHSDKGTRNKGPNKRKLLCLSLRGGGGGGGGRRSQ